MQLVADAVIHFKICSTVSYKQKQQPMKLLQSERAQDKDEALSQTYAAHVSLSTPSSRPLLSFSSFSCSVQINAKNNCKSMLFVYVVSSCIAVDGILLYSVMIHSFLVIAVNLQAVVYEETG